jgi:hypothetical protein
MIKDCCVMDARIEPKAAGQNPMVATNKAGEAGTSMARFLGASISVVAAVGVWALVACATTSHSRWLVLNRFFYWPAWPMFMDLNALWTSCAGWVQGHDPLLEPAYNFNYPRLWLIILSETGLNKLPVLPVALTLDAVFITCVVLFLQPVRFWGGVLLAGLLWSPPVRLLLERGNIDLFIFVLLAFAAGCHARWRNDTTRAWVGPLIIVFAALLKLYPFTALLAGAWIERDNIKARRWWIWATLITGLIFSVRYIELLEIARRTPQNPWGSFGVTVLGLRLYNHIFGVFSNETAFLIRIISTAAYLILAGAAWRIGNRWRFGFGEAPRVIHWIGFWLTAVIYVTTFGLGANYSYRLVLLILAIPFLLDSLKGKDAPRVLWARMTFIVLFVVMFSPFISARSVFILQQLFQWSLAFLFITGIVAMMARNPIPTMERAIAVANP